MRKIGVTLIGLFLVFSLFSFVLADTNNFTANANNTGDDANSAPAGDNSDWIENGFSCLKDEVGSACSKANTIEELAFTVLASPEGVADKCLNKLKGQEKYGGCWGESGCTIKETAMAVLALKHAGEDTKDGEKWLLSKERTADSLDWFVQLDSDLETECRISYDGGEPYVTKIRKDKRFDSGAGPCLSVDPKGYWLQVNKNCYNETFTIGCDQQFSGSTFYKRGKVYFPIEGTKEAEGLKEIKLSVDSKCFGDDSCDYEGSLWASYALLETNHPVEDYLSYLMAFSDVNLNYLPSAFLYVLTNKEFYAENLISKKDPIKHFWDPSSNENGRYYNTAIALLALSNSKYDEEGKAKEWLKYSQDSSNGCWTDGKDEIRDTAMILWALAKKGYVGGGGGLTPSTGCTQAGFFCITSSECAKPLENYVCNSPGTSCCEQNYNNCSTYGGKICGSGFRCDGAERDALGTSFCCLGNCVETQNNLSECKQDSMKNNCRSECKSNEESLESLDCYNGDVCCRPSNEKKSLWWVWLIVLLLLTAGGFFGWKYREKLKEYWFGLKSKFKKGNGKGSSNEGIPPKPGFPPRPGFPPIRRNQMSSRPGMSMSKPQKDSGLDGVFKKLGDISK